MDVATTPRLRHAATALALLALLASAGGARAEITVTFDPLHGLITQVEDPAPPETLAVQVTVDASATDLRGFSFVLEFDPTYVIPVSVSPGALLAGASCDGFFEWLNAAAVGDSLAVDGASLGCSFAGPGSIAELRFIGFPDNYGTSPLAWRSVRLRDSSNAELAVTCVDGTILHQPLPIRVEPVSFGRLKALYR